MHAVQQSRGGEARAPSVDPRDENDASCESPGLNADARLPERGDDGNGGFASDCNRSRDSEPSSSDEECAGRRRAAGKRPLQQDRDGDSCRPAKLIRRREADRAPARPGSLLARDECSTREKRRGEIDGAARCERPAEKIPRRGDDGGDARVPAAAPGSGGSGGTDASERSEIAAAASKASVELNIVMYSRYAVESSKYWLHRSCEGNPPANGMTRARKVFADFYCVVDEWQSHQMSVFKLIFASCLRYILGGELCRFLDAVMRDFDIKFLPTEVMIMAYRGSGKTRIVTAALAAIFKNVPSFTCTVSQVTKAKSASLLQDIVRDIETIERKRPSGFQWTRSQDALVFDDKAGDRRRALAVSTRGIVTSIPSLSRFGFHFAVLRARPFGMQLGVSSPPHRLRFDARAVPRILPAPVGSTVAAIEVVCETKMQQRVVGFIAMQRPLPPFRDRSRDRFNSFPSFARRSASLAARVRPPQRWARSARIPRARTSCSSSRGRCRADLRRYPGDTSTPML